LSHANQGVLLPVGWAGKPDPHAGRNRSGMIRTSRAHAPGAVALRPAQPRPIGKPGPRRLAPRRRGPGASAGRGSDGHLAPKRQEARQGRGARRGDGPLDRGARAQASSAARRLQRRVAVKAAAEGASAEQVAAAVRRQRGESRPKPKGPTTKTFRLRAGVRVVISSPRPPGPGGRPGCPRAGCGGGPGGRRGVNLIRFGIGYFSLPAGPFRRRDPRPPRAVALPSAVRTRPRPSWGPPPVPPGAAVPRLGARRGH
jgi:hypothetical protein